MTRKTLSRILIIAIIAALVGGIIGYRMYNMPHKDFANSKPDFELTAQTIFDEFTADESAATQKYTTGDKTIQIVGILSDFTQESDSTASVAMSATPDGVIIVNCALQQDQITKAAKLEVGTPLTLKGQCTGYQGLFDPAVFLIRGAIVE